MDLDEKDIDGSIFVKAEWEGFGEYMPPARSETLFQLDTLKKNRYEVNKNEQQELLEEQRAIDVNDPRYEKVLKNLQFRSDAPFLTSSTTATHRVFLKMMKSWQ